MRGAKSRCREVSNDLIAGYNATRDLCDVTMRWLDAHPPGQGANQDYWWDEIETLHYTHRQKVSLEDAITTENKRRRFTA